MTRQNDRPPFIAQQSMRLLLETEEPQQFLRAEYFRAGRAPAAPGQQQDLGEWQAVDRIEVAQNSVRNRDGSDCDLSRLVLTSDAGMGKTANIQWLHAELNRPGSDKLALLVDNVGRLPGRAVDVLGKTLAPLFQRTLKRRELDLSDNDALQILRQMLRGGRLVLMLDALDQAPPDGAAIATLSAMLEDPQWQSCRIILGGRPHALQRHWDALFDASERGWRFVVMEEFTEPQQREFLDTDETGRDRFELIPREARDVLSTPRVLEYLRELPTGDFAKIQTASDVYWQSINYMLKAFDSTDSRMYRSAIRSPDRGGPMSAQGGATSAPAKRRATLGTELQQIRNPNGVALKRALRNSVAQHLGPPLRG